MEGRPEDGQTIIFFPYRPTAEIECPVNCNKHCDSALGYDWYLWTDKLGGSHVDSYLAGK
jgi:hypothetical protein